MRTRIHGGTCVLPDQTAKVDLLLEDGLHPNAKGIDVMVARILPLVGSVLAAR